VAEAAVAEPAAFAPATPAAFPETTGISSDEARPIHAEPPAFIEVWWPKDTGPFRHRHHRGGHKQQSFGKDDAAAKKPHSAAEHRKPRRPTKPPRIEKPKVDADSPFAVLGSLRSQLLDKKNV
jgi:hypothetical protein